MPRSAEGKLEAQEEPMVSFRSKVGRKSMSLLKAVMQGESPLLVGGSAFLFYSGLQLIG